MNKHLRRGLAASVLVTSGLTIGHVADAATPSTVTGQITACANADHAVRIIDAQAGATCSTGETTIAWNANGGTTYNNNAAAQTITAGLNVASVTLPAGKYLLSGKTNVHNLALVPNFVQCGLTAGSENGRLTLPGGTAYWGVMTSQEVLTLTSTTTVDWFCNPGGLASEVTMTSLEATTLSAIN